MELFQLYFKTEKWRITNVLVDCDGYQSQGTEVVVLYGRVYNSDDSILDGLSCNYLINEKIGPRGWGRLSQNNLVLGSDWLPDTTTKLRNVLIERARDIAKGIISIEFGIELESEQVILFDRPGTIECKITGVSYSIIFNK